MKTPFHRRCMEVARSRWAPAMANIAAARIRPICDVKSRIDPACLSHQGCGSKLLLVLRSSSALIGTEKAKLQVTMATFVCMHGEICIRNEKYLNSGAL